MSKDGELNNNKTFRGISDKLDNALGTTYDDPKDSKIRATAHAAYHAGQYVLTGNQREWERAKDQLGTGYGGSTDNLEKYDESRDNNNKK